MSKDFQPAFEAENKDYYAHVYKDNTMSVPSASYTLITFNKVFYDPSGMWDSSDSSFVIPVSGFYLIQTDFQLESLIGIYRYLVRPHINGVGALYLANGFGGGNGTADPRTATGLNITGTAEMYFRKGDKVDLRVYHFISSTRTLPGAVSNERQNYFTIRLVKACEIDIIMPWAL